VLCVNARVAVAYSISCHSCRHLCGGQLKSSRTIPFRYKFWKLLSPLNANHMKFAWAALVFVALRRPLCAVGGPVDDHRLQALLARRNQDPMATDYEIAYPRRHRHRRRRRRLPGRHRGPPAAGCAPPLVLQIAPRQGPHGDGRGGVGAASGRPSTPRTTGKGLHFRRHHAGAAIPVNNCKGAWAHGPAHAQGGPTRVLRARSVGGAGSTRTPEWPHFTQRDFGAPLCALAHVGDRPGWETNPHAPAEGP